MVYLAVFNSDLHMTTTQFPEEARAAARDNETSENPTEDHANAPGCFPDYTTINTQLTVNWRQNSGGSVITINTSTTVDAYDEITTGRKNTFLVPYGKTGRDFIEQLTKHISDWNNGLEMQTIPQTAVVHLALGLQKPEIQSKRTSRVLGEAFRIMEEGRRG